MSTTTAERVTIAYTVESRDADRGLWFTDQFPTLPEAIAFWNRIGTDPTIPNKIQSELAHGTEPLISIRRDGTCYVSPELLPR